jgi:hypothetical protein
MRDHDGCEIGLKIGGDGVIVSVTSEQHGLAFARNAQRVSGVVAVAERSTAAFQLKAF